MRRLIYLTSLGIAPEARGAWVRGRGQAEQFLLKSGLDVTVLRPGQIVGVGGQGFNMMVSQAKRQVAIVMGSGRQKFRSIALDDPSYYLAGVLNDPRAYGQCYDAGCGDILTRDQMIDVAADVLSRRQPTKIHLPWTLLGVLAPLLERVSKLPIGAIKGVAESMGTDLTGDPTPPSHDPTPAPAALSPGRRTGAEGEVTMRVFVTGATGFIGSAVVQELLDAGHEVTGLARSEAAAKKLTAAGAQVHRGDVEDLESLRRGAAAADGAIHTAFFHEITHMGLPTRLRVMLGGSPGGIVSRYLSAAVGADRRALETLGRALAGADRPLVAAFGTMAMTPGRLATEDDAYGPNSVGGPRGQSEDTMSTLASQGVRTSVIRLPPVVHGEGDRAGFAPRLIQIALKKGASAYVGDGLNRWPAVHRLDAARLFRLALEKGTAGSRYHAIAEDGIPFREIAEVIGRRLNVPVVARSPEEAAKQFSWLAPFLPVDNPVSGQLTQERMGWRPTQPELLPDLDLGHYFKA